MAFAKIVAATDFSSGSVAALAAASLIARSDGAEVVVAHALETPTVFGGELPVPTEVIEELKDDALQGLEHAQRDVRALGVSRVSSQLLVGVVGGLLSFVESSKADLVVVGTHGRTGMSRILLGSMAEKIVRLAPCSVLVARSDHELVRFSHVLCAVDGGESSRMALARATDLAQTNKAPLTLLNVVEGAMAFSGRHAMQHLYLLDRASKELLRREAESLTRTAPRLAVDIRSAIGSAGAQILALVDDERSLDLVVMGSHGRTGIKRVFLGSVAEKVVRHARCSVLVAR